MDPERWRAVVAPEVKSLFGRPLRVLLATWFLSRDMAPTYLQEAQREMLLFGEAASGVAIELRLLVSKGMLNEFEDGRRVYFTPTSSPLWPVYRAIREAHQLWPSDASSSASEGESVPVDRARAKRSVGVSRSLLPPSPTGGLPS